MEKVKFLGLAADAPGSGKDTFFNRLQENHPDGESLVNVKFADALTTEVGRLFPYISREDWLEIRNDPTLKDKPMGALRPFRLNWGIGTGSEYFKFLLDKGYDAHELMSARQHLLIYGTEFRREYKGTPNYWLDKGLEAVTGVLASGQIPVVTDVRFPNEAQALKGAGGTLLHISADWVANKVLDRTTQIAEGHLKGWRFDGYIKNIMGAPEQMEAQFNARFKF